jgi:hypothetical protein
MIAITAPNLSEGWLQAFEKLLDVGGEAVNVAVSIEHPVVEHEAMRSSLDEFVTSCGSNNGQPLHAIRTVANTIFPQAFYLPRLGEEARAHLYEMQRLASRVDRRRNRSGTYFDRLIDWRGPAGTVNQLDVAIDRIRSVRRQGHSVGNAFELELDEGPAIAFSLPVYSAGKDNRIMGFPCLSHISLSLFDDRVHMTALYRNHEWVRRAYGNYLGLAQLMSFIAVETCTDVGELLCVSSHATAEVGHGRGFGRAALTDLATRCRGSLSNQSRLISVNGTRR